MQFVFLAKVQYKDYVRAFGESSDPAAPALYTEFMDMARYFEFIENIWSITSVKSVNKAIRKRNSYHLPLQYVVEGHPGQQYLKEAIAIFWEWRHSNRAGLTSETSTASIQTMTAVLPLSKYLQRRHSVKYLLTGKAMSNPIEGRFGIYGQANGENFFMSVRQMLLAEKKIRCLSLLQQDRLKSVLQIKESELYENMNGVFPLGENRQWLVDFLLNQGIGDITDDDAGVIYYVTGYIGHSISARRKCEACKILLVHDCHFPEPGSCILDIYKKIFDMADQGGLSVLTEICFAIAMFAFQCYSEMIANSDTKEKLFGCKNRRNVFVDTLHDVVETSKLLRPLLLTECQNRHTNFHLIVQTAFNCFAKNELKRLNCKPILGL